MLVEDRAAAVGTSGVRPVALLLRRTQRGDELEQGDYERAQDALGRQPRLTSPVMAARLAEHLAYWEHCAAYYNPGADNPDAKRAEKFALSLASVNGDFGAVDTVLLGAAGSWGEDLEGHVRDGWPFPQPFSSSDYKEAATQLRRELGPSFMNGDDEKRAAMVRDWVRNYRERGVLPHAERERERGLGREKQRAWHQAIMGSTPEET